MLNRLRSFAKGPIALVFIIIIAGALSLFFVPELVRGLNQQGAATVGSRTISEFDVSDAFQRQVDQIARQVGGRFTAEEARAMGLPGQVLGELISRSIIDQKARELGFGASDALIYAHLQEIDAFRDPATGAFSQRLYAATLARARLDPRRFEEELAAEIRSRPLTEAIEFGLLPPRLLAEPLVRWAKEERELTLVTIQQDAAPPPREASEDELRAYHAERRLDYEAPERRDFALVKLEAADLVSAMEVSDEDVRMEFEVRRDTLESPERRMLVELVATDEAVAADVAERLRQGEEPDAVAFDLGLPAPNRYEAVTREEIFDPAAAEAAFALEEGAVSDPVKGALAWAVWRADAVTPAVLADFEEMKDELRQEIASVLAGDVINEKLALFEDALAGGATLEGAAATAEIDVAKHDGIDREGFDATGARVIALSNRPAILARAFSVSPDFVSEVEELGRDGFFALRVDAVQPAAFRPYEDVAEDVLFAWEARETANALDALAETVRAALADGQAADALELPDAADAQLVTLERYEASAENFAVEAMERSANLQPGESFTLDAPAAMVRVLGQAFAAEPGEVVLSSAPDGMRLIVRVEGVRPLDEIDEGELAQARLAMLTDLTGDVRTMAFGFLQEQYEVRVNEDAVARAVGDVRE
ncbi:MAG: SurA N-terminal domain-containing protein [Caulobacterales bacterium]|nr:SurA N-terminal domain-containing protein [Caulobacterales bacterium]